MKVLESFRHIHIVNRVLSHYVTMKEPDCFRHVHYVDMSNPTPITMKELDYDTFTKNQNVSKNAVFVTL